MINALLMRGVLVFMIVISVQSAISQIVIDHNDMPSPGDTVRISIALNMDDYDFEETGEGYVWDYSGLIPLDQQVDTFVSVLQTPVFYWPFFLLTANMASPQLGELLFPELPLTDIYRFFNNSADRFTDEGFAATIFEIPLPLPFEDPDVLYEFPMEYGHTDSSFSGLELAVEGIGYISVSRKRVSTVDGWGTLYTPFGRFDALRLRSEVEENDSIYIDSISTGFPLERDYIEYKWLGKDQKLPLLQVSDDSFQLLATYRDSARLITTGVWEGDLPTHTFRLFPNPTDGLVSIDISPGGQQDVRLLLFDLQGEVLYDWSGSVKDGESLSFNLDQLKIPSGLYFLEMVTEDDHFTGKVMYVDR
ncbi:MAG: T9SS type A sorting domain-containing protein [bacterium]